MPRNGSFIYSVPVGTEAVPGTPIASAPYNAFLADLVNVLNGVQPIALGGTGAATAAAARTSLGLAIGTNVQAYSAALGPYTGAATPAADQVFYYTSATAGALTAFTAAGRAVVGAATAAAARSALRAFGVQSLKTAGFTVAAADAGTQFVTNLTANATATLAAVSGFQAGDLISFSNPSPYDLTIVRSSTNVLDGGTTTYVPAGQAGVLGLLDGKWQWVNRPRLTWTVRHTTGSGTSGGGTTAGSWLARPLNSTFGTNFIAGGSLASNRITLPAGVYRIKASGLIYLSDRTQGRLWDATAGALIAEGDATFNGTSPVSTAYSPLTVIVDPLVLTATTAIEFQYQVETARAADGLGRGNTFGGTNVFATVEIELVGR